ASSRDRRRREGASGRAEPDRVPSIRGTVPERECGRRRSDGDRRSGPCAEEAEGRSAPDQLLDGCAGGDEREQGAFVAAGKAREGNPALEREGQPRSRRRAGGE